MRTFTFSESLLKYRLYSFLTTNVVPVTPFQHFYHDICSAQKNFDPFKMGQSVIMLIQHISNKICRASVSPLPAL